jgi:hypothetical protein
MHSNPNRSAALPAHEQRVLDESAELHERITRLVAFIGESPIYQTLAQPDQFLLRQQLGVMQEYHRILKERILRFIR